MKVRLGFVSNSSTSGYIISLEEFNNVLELAGYFTLNIIHHENGEARYELANRYFSIFNNLLRASQSNLDPNTPTYIPTHNFDTRIVKREDGYYIDTDHEFYFDVKGIIGGIEEGEYGEYTKTDVFYLPEFDVLGNQKEVFSDSVCGNTEHLINIVLSNGTIICPICNKDEVDNNKISPEIHEEELEIIEQMWKERFKVSSEFFEINRLRDKMRDLGVIMATPEAVDYLSLYLEALVKKVTEKCLKLSSGKEITIEMITEAIEQVKTMKIRF